MFRILKTRLQQGYRTGPVPPPQGAIPDRYRGRPIIDPSRCAPGCDACVAACPTAAVALRDGRPTIDLGRCLFCAECERACPETAIRFAPEIRVATRTREALQIDGCDYALAQALDRQTRRIFGRSLKLRQVSAGGCNACEADVNVLNTLVFDLGRFGIQFVASPRHADGLLVTGPIPANMRLGLRKTWDALPTPRLVIAVGACAIAGGPFLGNPEVNDGIGDLLPVDLYIPGCPPHPHAILDGLLRLLGRLGEA